jgi:hypothetical protein
MFSRPIEMPFSILSVRWSGDNNTHCLLGRKHFSPFRMTRIYQISQLADFEGRRNLLRFYAMIVRRSSYFLNSRKNPCPELAGSQIRVEILWNLVSQSEKREEVLFEQVVSKAL